MSNKLNLLNKQYGKLTVIAKAESVLEGKTKHKVSRWLCRCECGTEKIIKTYHLTRGAVNSCGCFNQRNANSLTRSIKIEQKFTRLTTISFNLEKDVWNCLCECGKEIEVFPGYLVREVVKSCGCLVDDLRKQNAHKLYEARRQFEPHIASARMVWKRYTNFDKKCNLTFEQFYEITQRNCYYCNIEPYKTFNNFEGGFKPSEEKGLFIYNGLDRIDSSLFHTLDNVVSCCIICNRAKSNQTQEEFIKRVLNYKFDNFPEIKKIELPKDKIISIKDCYRRYSDGDLGIEEFYYLTQLPCFYCGEEKYNCSAKGSIQEFKYNGLDRIDSNLGHSLNNVVPCCYPCNWAKSKTSLEEHLAWMKRIKTYQLFINS